jgi:hypothetical protein
MALTGTFEDVGFAELLQMLNAGNRTGKLTVSRPGEQAVLHLLEGNVLRAVSKIERGPQVVYRILGWTAAEFSFERTDEPVIPNVDESTEGLILEGMKRFDEWQQLESGLPDAHVVLRQQAFAVNQRFEELSREARTVLRLVDAERDVATLVRESGLEPTDAVRAVAALLAEGIVEEWHGRRRTRDVVTASAGLPVATGAIDLSPGARFSATGHPSDQSPPQTPTGRAEPGQATSALETET